MIAEINSAKLVTPISGVATLELIPKPREFDTTAGLLVGQTVKNRTSDNIDAIARVTANSVDLKLVFFYPDTTSGNWYLHPDHDAAAMVVAFVTNSGRKYSRFLISDALRYTHFALWLTAGAVGDVVESYILPCRRSGGAE